MKVVLFFLQIIKVKREDQLKKIRQYRCCFSGPSWNGRSESMVLQPKRVRNFQKNIFIPVRPRAVSVHGLRNKAAKSPTGNTLKNASNRLKRNLVLLLPCPTFGVVLV